MWPYIYLRVNEIVTGLICFYIKNADRKTDRNYRIQMNRTFCIVLLFTYGRQSSYQIMAPNHFDPFLWEPQETCEFFESPLWRLVERFLNFWLIPYIKLEYREGNASLSEVFPTRAFLDHRELNWNIDIGIYIYTYIYVNIYTVFTKNSF